MTGTIELILILLLTVIQHGGDDVSCKRSIDTNVFVVGQTGFYEIYYCDSYQSTSNQISLWFRTTKIIKL